MTKQNVADIRERISATYDIILGLERSIEIMEDELRKEKKGGNHDRRTGTR